MNKSTIYNIQHRDIIVGQIVYEEKYDKFVFVTNVNMYMDMEFMLQVVEKIKIITENSKLDLPVISET